MPWFSSNRSGSTPVKTTGTVAPPSVTRNLTVSPTPRSREPSSTRPPMRKTSFGVGGSSITWLGERKKLIPSRIA